MEWLATVSLVTPWSSLRGIALALLNSSITFSVLAIAPLVRGIAASMRGEDSRAEVLTVLILLGASFVFLLNASPTTERIDAHA